MKRLNKKNLNTPTSHIIKEPNWFDIKRWRTLLKYFKGGRLLDIGSFGSLVPKMVKKEYPQAEIETLNWFSSIFPIQPYDYIVMGQVIEHLENPEETIKEVSKMLKPKGILALSTPLKETMKGEVDGVHHIWSFSISDIRWLLRDFKEVVIEVIGSEFQPEYRYNFPHLVVFGFK